MHRKTLAALLASLFSLPVAAVNVPLPPELPMAPDFAAPPAPRPPHLAAADAARSPADEVRRAGDEARRAGEEARRAADEVRRASEEMSREIEAEMGALFAHRVSSHRVVKGQPYSAEVVTENRQVLADGNVISRKTTGRVYRDADGRTRDETEGREGKARSIAIFDPVAGRSTVLLPESKRAIVSAAAGTTTTKQVVKVDGKDVTRSPSGKRIVVSREDVDGLPTEVVNVQVIRLGDGDEGHRAPVPPVPPVPPSGPGIAPPPPPPAPPAPPGVAGTLRFESIARLGKGVVASLGTKDLGGVRVEGKSTTWTIPAGQIGNSKPIQVVSESWYSPELQVTVSSRYNDPRTGEVIYRLASIQRGAPAADLFRVPAGYEVRDRGRDRDEMLERASEAREKAQEARQRAREERDRARQQRERQLEGR